MKASHPLAAGAIALSLFAVPNLGSSPAQAIGCLSGAAAGAVAGHYAHHHAVLGAIGGCIAGRHVHNMQRQRAAAAAHDADTAPTPSSTPN